LLIFFSSFLTIILQLNQDQETNAVSCGSGSKTLAESLPVCKNSNPKSIYLVRFTKVLDLTGSGFLNTGLPPDQFQNSTLIMSTFIKGAGWAK
jgi:hypothetical protein